MIKKIKEQSVPYTIMTIAILAFAVFFLCKCWIHISTVPYAVNEYREAADVQLTEAFLKGEIPYRLESLDASGEMPPVLYQYSFLNSAVSALFALILGGRVVLAHYIVATLSMIGSAVLAYHNIDRYSGQTAAPMLGAVLTLFCHWRFGYLSTTPNSLGIFLTLLTFTLAVSPRIKYKAVITAFMCILLFYTKLYFITIAGAIFIYDLLHDRREAFSFLGMTILHGLLSVLLIQAFWPLYFTYSLFFINGTTVWASVSRLLSSFPFLSHSESLLFPVGTFVPQIQLFQKEMILFQAGTTASAYVFEQFQYMATVFGPLFAVLAVAIATVMIRKTKRRERIHFAENDVLTLALVQVAVQGLCMLVLGRGDGAYLSYYLQLWIPYVTIAALICLQKYLQFPKKYVNVIILAAVSFLLIYLGYKKLPLFMMTEEDVGNWKQAKVHVETYESGDIYYAPVLAYLAMEQGKPVYNNGHTGIMNGKIRKIWSDNKYASKVFPYAGKIIDRNRTYQEQIKEKIREHSYALVTTDDEQLFVDDEFLRENGYIQIDDLPLAVGNADYNVRFWVPKEE